MSTRAELTTDNTVFTADDLELIRDCLCVASERAPMNSGELFHLTQDAKDRAHALYKTIWRRGREV